MVGGTARLLKALRFFQKRRATPATLALAPATYPLTHKRCMRMPRDFPALQPPTAISLNHTFPLHPFAVEPLLFRTIAAPLAAHKYMRCTRFSARHLALFSYLAASAFYTCNFFPLFFSIANCIFFATRIFAGSQFKELYDRQNLERAFPPLLPPLLEIRETIWKRPSVITIERSIAPK